jgi:putative tryptophan/tyrosine transport system substrate-binding protein
MRRREFITLLGGAASSWPLAVRAQQSPMPVIGFLDIRSPDTLMEDRLRAFRQGLKDTGYVERENVTIEYRWAENQVDRLPELAAELVRRQVTVFVTSGGSTAVFAAKAATTTIPIVFLMNDDPVKLRLVASLARPGGNLTGMNIVTLELAAKRLELLRELVPGAARIAVLVSAGSAETMMRDMEPITRALGCKSSSSTSAPFAKSMRPSQLFHANGLMHSSSPAIPSWPAGVSNWPNWRRSTGFPRHMRRATMPRPVG